MSGRYYKVEAQGRRQGEVDKGVSLLSSIYLMRLFALARGIYFIEGIRSQAGRLC